MTSGLPTSAYLINDMYKSKSPMNFEYEGYIIFRGGTRDFFLESILLKANFHTSASKFMNHKFSKKKNYNC